MKYFCKKITTIFLSAFVTVMSVGPAFADSASSQATAKVAELAQHKTNLVSIRAKVATFKIKSSYCEYFHKEDKRADEAALKVLSDRVSSEMRAVGTIRRILIATVTRNQAARTALDQALPGGSGTIVDGSLFRPFNRMRSEINLLLSKKRAELKAAATRPCGDAVEDTTEVAMPTFVVVNPLIGVPTTGTYEDAASVGSPTRFCHEDEKREWLGRISAMRRNAQSNERAAENLRDKLRQLETQTKADRQAAWNAADAAAKSGETTTQNNQVTQLRAYDAALKKIASGIRQAISDQRKWRKVDLQLAKDWKVAASMPISDCTDPDLTPAGTLGGTQVGGFGMAAPTLKPVDIPNVPEKVCVASVKSEIINKSYTALNNAWNNRDQWNARIEAARTALNNATGDARQPLINARNEARTESSKWNKIAENAKAANERALAIIVENCDQTGGLLEIGKTYSTMPNVNAGVPEAVSQNYDLPKVPDYVCTWEEKQALIARARKAREVASYNHSQWGPRATALGQLLFGENAVGGDRTDLLKAHAEARAQSDFWADQMLEVARRVYWELRELEVRDCTQPKNKTSMGTTSGTGSFNDVLENARNTAPAFNGGGGSSDYGPIGNEYQPVYGYPDFEKIRLLREIRGEAGFDGSEAENDLEETLRNVETMPTEQPYNNGGGMMNDYPSGKKEPKAGSYSPMSYPTETSPETNSGEPDTGFASEVGLELETSPIEYRNGSEDTILTKQPGIPKYTNINGPRPTAENSEAFAETILEEAREKTSGGKMIRIDPPRLVIPVGATGSVNNTTTSSSQEQAETEGGQ
ncbi:MAG: hypothetical protein GXP04_04860 [Alphaproteobacteria bacterium]|nr:hypothetical protein [Alphaproteobacteria bacterium]